MTDASELEDEIAQLRDLASDADDQPDMAEQVVFSTPWTKRAASDTAGSLSRTGANAATLLPPGWARQYEILGLVPPA